MSDSDSRSDTPQPDAPQPGGAASHQPRMAPATAAPTPPVVVVPAQTSGISRWFSWLGWMGLMFCIPIILGMVAAYHEYFDTTHGVQEKFLSGSAQLGSDKIAVIRLEGAIMDGDGFVKQQIDRIREDENVKGAVIRINSPGGTISGSDFIYHHLQKLKKDRNIPLVVSMGSIAASGGYYVAMAVGDESDSIFAEPTTTTGSIGVIIPHYDLSGFLERLDIKEDSIASHPRKRMLSMTREMTADHRQLLEQYITEAFDRFKEIVKSGRPEFQENPDALTELATGEIFSAQRAKEVGLVDELGFIEDATQRVAQLAGLQLDAVRVVTYRQPQTLLAAVGWQKVQATPPWSLEHFLEFAAPRPFYLATSLPALVSTSDGR